MGIRGLLFIIFLSSTSLGLISQSQALGTAPSCTLLFTLGAPALSDAEEYSLRRFQTSLERSREEDLSPLAQKWKSKVGAPIFVFRNLLRVNRETHASLHMSLDGSFVISKSSAGIFRLLDARNGRIISQAPDISEGLQYRAEVIFTSSDHYVIAVENNSSIARDKYLGVDGFHPHHLMLFNRNSQLVAEYFADGRMKNSVVSDDGRSWLNATQGNFDITDLKTKKISQHWIGDIHTSEHPINYELIVNAVNFSRDGLTVAIAAGDSRGRRNATLFVVPRSSLTGERSNVTEAITEMEIPLARIYRIDSTPAGGWRIEGTPANQDSHSAVQVIEIP